MAGFKNRLRPADAVGRGFVALVGIGYAGGNLGAGVFGSGAQRQIPGTRLGRTAGLASLEGDADLAADAPGVQRGIDDEGDHDHHEQNA